GRGAPGTRRGTPRARARRDPARRPTRDALGGRRAHWRRGVSARHRHAWRGRPWTAGPHRSATTPCGSLGHPARAGVRHLGGSAALGPARARGHVPLVAAPHGTVWRTVEEG